MHRSCPDNLAILHRSQDRRGEALSLSRLAFDTTFVVAPLTLGFVADSVSCEAALLVAGAANAVAAGTFLALMRRRSRLDAEAVEAASRRGTCRGFLFSAESSEAGVA